jgi:hypothetical protein
MIVSKTIALNRIEPALVSFRAPMGMETRLDVTFLDRKGKAYTSDLAAQLQLTGRTGERTAYYQMPAIDVVNGKARAFIPADTLTDPNGYRLRITGTFEGEPALLAQGLALPIFTAGPQAVPLDTIDTIDLTFDYNSPAELDVSVWQDVGKNSEYDLTAGATTVSASVYTARGGARLASFTVTVVDANTVTLSLTAAQVNGLPPSCWWSLTASSGSGLTTLCEGSVTVKGTVIPELVETTALYDYQKPALGNVNPTSGQIIHDSITQNLLKVAKVTGGLQDLSATLELVRAGDEVLLGASTWVVQAATEAAGWYEFTVTPVAQDAASGSVTVTFRRPV